MAPAFLKARAPSLHWVTVPRHPFSCPPLPLPFGRGLWWAFPLFRPRFSMNKRHPSPTAQWTRRHVASSPSGCPIPRPWIFLIPGPLL
jgi:hypothetical protein